MLAPGNDVRESPIYFLGPTWQMISFVASILALYDLQKYNITTRKMRLILSCGLLWNCLTQIWCYYFYNYVMNRIGFSVTWLVANWTLVSVNYTNSLILQCFESLKDWITNRRIFLIQIAILVLYVLCNSVAFFRILVHIPSLRIVEEMSGSAYVALSTIYDNAQVFYLTFVVYSRHGRKNAEEASKQLRKAMMVNVIVCILDWVTFLLFLTQALLPKNPTSYVMQQIAVAHTGIHASLLVAVFQRLKSLTFAGRKLDKIALYPKQPHVRNTAEETVRSTVQL
jgi:hypothetical protein